MTLFRKDKNSQAFRQELYHLHYRRIYNICLRIIGNSQDAEEAMQDVFLKIFDTIEKLKDETAFYSWSQKIAVHYSIDRVRKKKPVFEQIDNLSVADDEPEDEIELSVEAIQQEMKNLPDGYRMVLSMRLFEEYEFEEIARALHIKESTARSQYIRGRDKLAEILKLKLSKYE
jgi:RNA polymerase sigma-70 factor (ECF subfamily)